MSQDRLADCQQDLGYAFRDPERLRVALTHSSIKSDSNPSNERMEFLGDSVLGAIVAEHLYHEFPGYDEGELSRIKSVVVSAPVLAREAKRLRLPRYIFVGKGMSNLGKLPNSLLANAFEAVVAAIYLDRGFAAAREFVLGHLAKQVQAVVCNQHQKNYKSILQHLCQKEFNLTPTYTVTRVEGPDHSKQFEVVAVLGEREMMSGGGSTKKDAEQRAAEATLKALDAEMSEPAPAAKTG